MGSTPSQVQMGGTPSQVWTGGTCTCTPPTTMNGWGTPTMTGWGIRPPPPLDRASGGRNASCVHAGGLSYFIVYWRYQSTFSFLNVCSGTSSFGRLLSSNRKASLVSYLILATTSGRSISSFSLSEMKSLLIFLEFITQEFLDFETKWAIFQKLRNFSHVRVPGKITSLFKKQNELTDELSELSVVWSRVIIG